MPATEKVQRLWLVRVISWLLSRGPFVHPLDYHVITIGSWLPSLLRFGVWARAASPPEFWGCTEEVRANIPIELQLRPSPSSLPPPPSHGLECHQTEVHHSVHGPSMNMNTRTCSIQENNLLLSCVGENEAVQRLCSCRSYKRGQVALCLSCTR